jgi:arylsulfatase A-like enzyme
VQITVISIRKLFLRVSLTIAALSLTLLTSSGTSSPSPAKPNILFLLIDDMGYGDLSCYGGRPGLTPNIDRLANEGLRFSQFYVGAPMCSASRTAFTTGEFGARWRITSYLASREENDRRGMAQWLDSSAPTLARTLHSAGYATGHFGKWHMGGQRDVGDAPLIKAYGFDESLTQFEGLGDRILPLLDAFDGNPAQKYALGSDNLGHGQIQWMDRSKTTTSFADRALKFIQRAEKDGKPFYVNLWPDDVHSPFFPPKDLRGDGSKRERYLGVTHAMDQQVAAILDYVRKSPILRTNTIILVASDNGPEPGAGSAGQLRGHKGMLYEGGIREPFIVWAPGFMKPSVFGTTNRSTVVAAVDFFPTIAKLASTAMPARESFDGEDLSNALLGRSQATRGKPLFWVRPPDRPGDHGQIWPDLAMRQGDWKLLLMRDGTNPQLYDLLSDPSESRNLAAKHPEIVGRMSQPLLTWSQSLPGRQVSVNAPAGGGDIGF